MKTRILLFALILTTAIAAGSPVIYNNIRESRIPYEKIIDLISKDLGLDTMAFKLYISESTAFDNSTGGTSQTAAGIAIIINNKATRVEATEMFIHELVHVQQLLTEKLIIRRNGTWFEGQKVGPALMEADRPQEKQARSVTEKLIRKYKKELKELTNPQKP